MPTEVMEPNVKVENAIEPTRNGKTFIPKADIYEAKDHLLLITDMPGVKQDSVDITIEQNILTIYGKVEPVEYPDYSLTYGEYNIGDYRRVFALSNEIDRDGIQASVKNGVLKLKLPKSKRAMPKKIAVQTQ
jgi:HSP20 family molecular chaperone IbpA